MSYDIHIKDRDTGDVIVFDKPVDVSGGTYAIGGTPKAWLNITYNYGAFYYDHIDKEKGIRAIYGKTIAEAAPMLLRAIQALGIQRSSDYWEPTPGNAGAALLDLLALGAMCPNGVFDGD